MRAKTFTLQFAFLVLLAPVYAHAEAMNIVLNWVTKSPLNTRGQLSYSMIGTECLHLVTSAGVDLTSTDTPASGYNFLCGYPGYSTVSYVSPSDNLTRALVVGEQIKLCRSSNLSDCSNLVTVEEMSATLTSVKVGEGFVQWAYRKNYWTCVHPMWTSPWQMVPKTNNAWCEGVRTGADFVATISQEVYNRDIVVGDSITFYGGNSDTTYGPVIAGTLTNKVKLNYVLVGDGKVRVSYDKNFTTCAHLLRANNQIVHSANLFCETQKNEGGSISDDKRETIAVKNLSDLTTNLKAGELVKLCHGNNYNICSDLVAVTSTVVVPPDSVTLGYVVRGGGKVKLAYKKNFSSCVQLVPVAGTPSYHSKNLYCDKDKDTEVSIADTEFNSLPATGTKVKLCHVSNAKVCSALVEVESLPPDTSGCH